MNFPYSLTDQTLTVYVGLTPYTVDRSAANWDAIKEALNNPDTTDDEMISLVSPLTTIQQIVEGVAKDATVEEETLTLREGYLWYGDEPVDSALARRILDIHAEGLDITPWFNFAKKVYANPFKQAREELYLWLEKADLPICEDGDFPAYKKVRGDYTDIYTGKMSNAVGQTVVMPGGRAAVDADRSRTCSTGLHFCSRDYLPEFGTGEGTRVVIVKINPADVVSIPEDYDNSKGRTWRYTVIDEVDKDQVKDILWPSVVSTDDYESEPDEATPPDSDGSDEESQFDSPTLVDRIEEDNLVRHLGEVSDALTSELEVWAMSRQGDPHTNLDTGPQNVDTGRDVTGTKRPPSLREFLSRFRKGH